MTIHIYELMLSSPCLKYRNYTANSKWNFLNHQNEVMLGLRLLFTFHNGTTLTEGMEKAPLLPPSSSL